MDLKEKLDNDSENTSSDKRIIEPAAAGKHETIVASDITPARRTQEIPSEAAWYALYTRSRHEKKLLSELSDRSIEVFLPMREILSRWKDRRKRIWVPLFPGYIFVHQENTGTNRYRVLNIPGAVRFIGFDEVATPVPDEQIDGIRRFLEVDLSVDPYPDMKVGRRVEVIAGPLKGIQGKLIKKKGKFRFILHVDLIRQAVSVEIDASDVRPL